MFSKDLEYISERIGNVAKNETCLILYGNDCYKLKKGNYFPDDTGIIVLKRELDWTKPGLTVLELYELLRMYKDRIFDIVFEVSTDGKTERVINVIETNRFYNVTACLFIVGNLDEKMITYPEITD